MGYLLCRRCLACTAVMGMGVMGMVGMAVDMVGTEVMAMVAVATRGQPIPTTSLPTMVIQLCLLFRIHIPACISPACINLLSRIPIPACINLLQYKWEILPLISPQCSILYTILLLWKLCITQLLCKSKKRLPCMFQARSYM